jgi:hypothetical protein
MLSDYDSFIKSLESLGEIEVSSKLSQGIWSSQKKKWASDWSMGRSSFKRDAREEDTLSIAKDANRIASEALAMTKSEARLARRSRWIDRIIPTIAIIIAAVAAREDIIWLISALIKKILP